MKVVVVSPFAIMNATFETDLEIIQNHLDLGDDVTVLVCNADLTACDPNLRHDVGLCLRCVARRKAGIAALTAPPDVRQLVNLTEGNRRELAALPNAFDDLEALRAFRFEDLDVGWGVLSGIASMMRDPAPDMRAEADVVRRLLVSSVSVYRSVQNHIDELKPDRLYLFSGRFALMRATFRAARSKNVDCFIQERASSFRHYQLVKNNMPHDPIFYQDMIKRYWDEGPADEREIMGASLYVENAHGICQFFQSFTDQQNQRELPKGWDPTKNNVAVYTGSDDEWVAIGDIAKNHLYVDQLDGLTRIIESIRGDDSLHLYIRMHPNLKTMKQEHAKRFLGMGTPNVTIIPPDSTVSTYDLMRAATRVLTFGSTTGIEAVYWGKPSILAGTSFYSELGGTYNPKTHEECIQLLKADLPPKPKEAALKFGYFTRMHGTRFRHFQPNGIPGGPFRGRMIVPDRKTRMLARTIETAFAKPARTVHLKLLEHRLAP